MLALQMLDWGAILESLCSEQKSFGTFDLSAAVPTPVDVEKEVYIGCYSG